MAPSLESYRYLVDSIWKEYEIPYFVDAKTEILFSPMSEAIASLFDIIERDFRREDVFRFLRTGLTELSNDEIDFLENYIISTGIRGKKKYFHPFAIRSNSFCQDEDLIKINSIRERFIEPFIEFDKSIGNKSTVRDIATSLYNFIFKFNFEEKIEKRGKRFEAEGISIKAKEYSQIYPPHFFRQNNQPAYS